ncbi:uncharacterized protein PG986_002577 [Apiospora aurea]|uniref:Uncharacterized protein n=1 Tax=Apiospora aurea TaxID=335848 RepID=A0ABR1QQ24_9PEZI
MGIIRILDQTRQPQGIPPPSLAGGRIVRRTSTGDYPEDEPGPRWEWFDSMETGYWNALASILIVVFIGGSIVALRLLFTWHREEQEVRRRQEARRRARSRRRTARRR